MATHEAEQKAQQKREFAKSFVDSMDPRLREDLHPLAKPSTE